MVGDLDHDSGGLDGWDVLCVIDLVWALYWGLALDLGGLLAGGLVIWVFLGVVRGLFGFIQRRLMDKF